MPEDAGQVRAILGRHAGLRSPLALRPPTVAGPRDAQPPAGVRPAADPRVPEALPDPNALLSASSFAADVEALSPSDQRRLAADYVALWARTFRTLVTHLRGRPERALALFADEVYPFLRGHRLAARVEPLSSSRARLTLATGLPDAYLCGLVESFVGLSGASTTCTPVAPGLVEVHYRVASTDLLARWAQHTATLRLNLVAAALLAATLGIALAVPRAEVSVTRALIVLVGTAAAQVAANALHALRSQHPAGPLAPLRPGRTTLVSQLVTAAVIALMAAAYLAATGTPLVLVFAAAGLGVGLLYAPLRDRGLGPVVTFVLYGPLIAEGALHAFDASAHHLDHIAVLPWTFLPGALAAAALYVDDLADAPLDEAGGKRTLAVRLPRRSQGLVYAVLLGVAFAPLAAVLAQARLGPSPLIALPALVLAVAGLLLIVRVRTSLGEPRRLAPARLGTQAVHAGATLLLAFLLAGGAA